MPGRGSYGPGGKWIHDRAHRIMESSPETPKRVAYAVATQQAHKVGKSPKGFRTKEGVREAKQKFTFPKKLYQKTAEAKPEKRLEKMIEQLPKEFQALFKGPGEPVEKKAAHPFESTLKGMLIKEAVGKKKRQQAQRRKAKIKAPPATEYKSPKSYVEGLFGGADPGDVPKREFSARVKARKMGIRTRSGRLQPYTVRQRGAGIPKPAPDTGPRVERKQRRKKPSGPQRPAGGQPKAPRQGGATAATVKKVTRKVSKLRRYGLPIGAGLAGAAALGGLAYLSKRKKEQEADIEKYWKGKRKRAMVEGMVDELQKIAQEGAGGGTLRNRLRLGATSPAAQASIQSAVQGNVGTGAAAAGGGGGGAETPPPPPPPPTTPPPPGGGDIGAPGGGIGAPSADPFGGQGAPGGGNPLAGASAGGSPLGGANAPPPPPPPPTSGGIGAGSLLSPQRRRGPNIGGAPPPSATPGAEEFGG